MSLLANLTAMGHLTEAVIHFNKALDLNALDPAVHICSKVDVARTMFDGLNKLQTEWLMNQSDQQIGEVKAFQTMILSGLSSEAKDDLLRSVQIKKLVALHPKIMNHDILRRGGYRPDVAIETSLAKDAVLVHQKLESAYREIDRGGNEIRERVIKRVAELLYVVRSNIAHGEKTPYGPDLKKRERDEQVCISIVPLLELLFDMLLDQPCKKLISYGTLAPGQPNHSLVSDLKGEWDECVIRGALNQDQGLSQFSWDPAGSEQNASLFTSGDLPTNWHRIDKFEGARYRRRLVPTKTRTGIAIAYAYIAS